MTIWTYLKRYRDRLIGERDVACYRKLGMVIGDEVYIGPGNRFDPSHAWLITIGDDVVFGPNVHILAHDAALRRRLGYTKNLQTRVGSHCFIGSHVLIMPGVTIGSNCIIGAGSLVTKSVPDGSVAFGHPAKVVMPTAEFEERWRAELETSPYRWHVRASGREFTLSEKEEMRAQTSDGGAAWGA